MHLQRTTVSTTPETLRTLQAEADRRKVSLAALLREVVEEKARSLRASRKPRLGTGRSTDGYSATEVTAKAVAQDPR